MGEFRVWAPRRRQVDVVLPAGHGCRCGPATAQRLRRLVGLPLSRPGRAPTIRSVSTAARRGRTPARPSSPRGIDGPSRVVDHAAFAWTDAGWRGLPLAGSVFYECHVGTFSAEGTFDGVIEHLDHLADLGVDAIELMPVAEFSGDRGWGYDGVDLFAPHHAYGGPDGLKRLVDAAHARGLGVVLDVVYNHLGPAGNYLPEFGPYFSAQHQTNWGDAVNFDGPGSDEVRRFVIDNALMWLRDYHCDGLRLDAVHAIVDDSATHILEQLAAEVAVLAAHAGRPLFLVAESDLNDPRFVRSRDAGGYGLRRHLGRRMASRAARDADRGHQRLLRGLRPAAAAGQGAAPGVGLRRRLLAVPRPGPRPFPGRPVRQPVRGLHAEPRPGRQPGHRRAQQRADERGPAAGGRGAAADLAVRAAAVPGRGVGRGTPFQYFTSHPDPELGRAVSEGRRSEFAAFGWDPAGVPDPQDPATFERSRLDWTEIHSPRHASLLDWYRRLIALRRQVPALTDPRLDRAHTDCDPDAGWLVVRRGPVTVAANLGAGAWTFPAAAAASLLAASDPRIGRTGQGFVLPPDTVAILNETPAP